MPTSIQKAFEEYCLANSKYDIEEDFAAHRIAAQVVNDMEDLVEEEHLKLRDTWVDWETADGETFHGLGVFPKFKNNPGAIWRPMPPQGGDTVDVIDEAGLHARADRRAGRGWRREGRLGRSPSAVPGAASRGGGLCGCAARIEAAHPLDAALVGRGPRMAASSG